MSNLPPIVVNIVFGAADAKVPRDLATRIERATREALSKIVAGEARGPDPNGAYQRGHTYRAYCTDDALDVHRPFGNVLNDHTFSCEERLLRQLHRDGIPLDPPDAAAFMAWVERHEKGRAGLDGHRLAYARLLGYYGLYIPPIMHRSWDTQRAVDRALHEGRPLRRFNRHLKNGPLDVLKLLAARPFEDPHMNEQFHHAISLLCLTGPRSSEPRDLLLTNVRPGEMRIVDWWQEKKDSYRSIFVPERWFWDGPGPSVDNFLKDIRPQFEPAADEPRYFLSSKGEGYATPNAWRVRMGVAVSRILGYPVGPHTFRRFCATMRYVYDWSEEQIAEYLYDTPEVVRGSYIDYDFARRVGRRHAKSASNERPALPPLLELAGELGMANPHDRVATPLGPAKRVSRENASRKGQRGPP